MEEYKTIDDFENYEVSNLGNVRNKKTGRILKQRFDKYGYCRVNLYNDKKMTVKKIHQIVANAFIENPENKPIIDHIDGDKLNNNVENLRFATNIENSHNSKIPKNNTSSVKGVSFNKRDKKWISYIKIDGIRVHLGSFDNLTEAKKARVKRANEAFGNFTHSCEKI